MRHFCYSEEGAQAGCEPLTVKRALGDVPVANVSLATHQQVALQSLGYRLVEDKKCDLEISPAAWFDSKELASFVSDEEAGQIVDEQGGVLAHYKKRGKKICQSKTSFLIRYSWDFLRANELAIAAMTQWENHGTCHSSLYVEGRLSVGRGTKILPGVVVEGDVVIGDHCKVGPNCYLRGSTTVGSHCHVGQAVELKNSILFSHTNVGHLSYIGDSILGEKVNLGAGTITSNLRHDGKTHRSAVAGSLVDTGRRKYGAVIGDRVHTGIHTSIYPGRKIWPGLTTLPGDIVTQDLQQ